MKPILQKNVLDLGLKRGDVISYGGPYSSSDGVSWDGNADNTSLIMPHLRNELRLQYLKAKMENKRFIIVTHSWGTVLGTLALFYEYDIQPDLFITLSTPFGTENIQPPIWDPISGLASLIIYYYKNDRIIETINANGPFLRNADDFKFDWSNYWALGDLISGPLFKDNISDKQVDIYHDTSRSIFSTPTWHSVTSLSKNKMDDVDTDVYEKNGKYILYAVKAELYQLIHKDSDEDDSPDYLDCEPLDPNIYPGAQELCDGKDNQCPGDPGYDEIDEGCSPPVQYGVMVQHFYPDSYFIAVGFYGDVQSADVIDGPNIAGTFPGHAYLSQRPTIGDIYSIRITYKDGTSEVINYEVEGINDNFAEMTYPADYEVINTAIPVFSWNPPSGYVDRYHIGIEEISNGNYDLDLA